MELAILITNLTTDDQERILPERRKKKEIRNYSNRNS
jgi:hypothetical protein